MTIGSDEEKLRSGLGKNQDYHYLRERIGGREAFKSAVWSRRWWWHGVRGWMGDGYAECGLRRVGIAIA